MPNSQSALALIRAVDAALKASRHEYGEMTDKFLGALHDAGFEVVPVRTSCPASISDDDSPTGPLKVGERVRFVRRNKGDAGPDLGAVGIVDKTTKGGLYCRVELADALWWLACNHLERVEAHAAASPEEVT